MNASRAAPARRHGTEPHTHAKRSTGAAVRGIRTVRPYETRPVFRTAQPHGNRRVPDRTTAREPSGFRTAWPHGNRPGPGGTTAREPSGSGRPARNGAAGRSRIGAGPPGYDTTRPFPSAITPFLETV
ncbi:hypothetical protein EAO69_30075 [Streptomyces sp. me109]|nr:hypothetical protein EAO69_30075 [Streptomyces sp. me109]